MNNHKKVKATHVEEGPLPPLHPRIHLFSLPDIAQEAIADYLTSDGIHRMTETSRWGMETYGGQVLDVYIRKGVGRAMAVSILQRRPGLDTLFAENPVVVEAIGEAMKIQSFNQVLTLDIRLMGEFPGEGLDCLIPLINCLGDGACPKLVDLFLTMKWREKEKHRDGDAVVAALGAALRSRMMEGKGPCCGLQTLFLYGCGLADVSPLLSSGACEALVDLRLASSTTAGTTIGDKTYEAVTEWLSRTKAAHLETLVLKTRAFPFLPISLASALFSPGMAPKLQQLDTSLVDRICLLPVVVAIRQGAWPHLRALSMILDPELTLIEMVALMDAIGVGLPRLEALSLVSSEVTEDVAAAIATGLRRGACPVLHSLELAGTSMGDVGMIALAQGLRSGAPCGTTLRRLDLSATDIGGPATLILAETMMNSTALSNLEYLDLSCNDELGDIGVSNLVHGVLIGGLNRLVEIKLDNVDMSDFAARELTALLLASNLCPNLRKLSLMGNPRIRKSVAIALLRAAESSRAGVEVLIDLDALRDDEQLQALGEGGDNDDSDDDSDSDGD